MTTKRSVTEIKELVTFAREQGAAKFVADGVEVVFFEPRRPSPITYDLSALVPTPGEVFSDDDLGFSQPEFLQSNDDPDAVKP